jgi:hypothetical protein
MMGASSSLTCIVIDWVESGGWSVRGAAVATVAASVRASAMMWDVRILVLLPLTKPPRAATAPGGTFRFET